MATGPDTSSFFGSTIPSIKLETIGDKISGQIIDKELRQQTDLDTGELLYWPDGRAKQMAIITMQVQEPSEEDDGRRNLFVRGLMQAAIRDAVKEAHKTDLIIGDWLTVEFTGERTPTRKGLNGMKEYAAKITDKEEPPF